MYLIIDRSRDCFKQFAYSMNKTIDVFSGSKLIECTLLFIAFGFYMRGCTCTHAYCHTYRTPDMRQRTYMRRRITLSSNILIFAYSSCFPFIFKISHCTFKFIFSQSINQIICPIKKSINSPFLNNSLQYNMPLITQKNTSSINLNVHLTKRP